MRRWRTARERALQGDAGIGTLEYIGIITIAAVLITAVVLSLTSMRPADQASAALCRIMEAFGQGGGCDPTPGRDAEDYVPPEECVVSSHGQEDNASVTVVVTVEGGEQWVIEQLGDGTYRLTRAREGGLGIGVGVGFDVSVTNDGQSYGLGATADASAALVVGGGESYIVHSADEARRVLDHKRNDETKDLWFGDDNPLRDGVDWLNEELGGSNEYEQLDPDEWFVEGGVEGEASAGANAIIGSAGAEAFLEAYVGRTHRKDGTSTDYLRADMGIGGGLQGHGVTASGYDIYQQFTLDGSMAAVMEVDRDEDGNPVALRIRSVTMWNPVGDNSYSGPGGIDGDPSYTERVVEIPLETTADRRLATRVMHAAGLPYYPGITDSVDLPQTLLDRFDPVALGRELGEAAADRGYIYEQTYTQWENEDGVNAQGKVGLELGLAIESIESGRSTTGYRYFDGTGMVDRAECVV
ncbi:hypothetical protein J1G42_07190 [Cellulomonas sp. zg-ZUI222]|uniref:Uncharacterized protein n=1 Tax=Cellulomonas wangleii TaxID=2816956 RepID=A0ABX8D1Y7_9CELL|nr:MULTISPECIES: hypothetical protein [Cellulomonas]MBO0899746.1 hypothetical protein [Cellulomonas sp. zg-ZUI22]MBO0920608.1 hypothetical protein [Cellulomonas wangleii]MBO0922974.1 hypothetical protein [Cellulomonas wangleii]QVI61364.1 hypothetical protein KG103_12850 [Cellulomonas wangleii]